MSGRVRKQGIRLLADVWEGCWRNYFRSEVGCQTALTGNWYQSDRRLGINLIGELVLT